jgi:hemerythrin
MAFFDWSAQYSVGVAKIDEQHRKLVGFLNDLYEAMKAGQGKETLGQVLDGLVDYTRTHFAAEEGMMKLYGYPDLPAHKAVHEKMTAKVLDIQREFKAGKISSPIQVTNFLKDWLAKHISETDRRYAPHFAQRGVK